MELVNELKACINDLLNYMWTDECPAFKEQAIKRAKALVKKVEEANEYFN